jgi:iron complex outermembrane receptor protein
MKYRSTALVAISFFTVEAFAGPSPSDDGPAKAKHRVIEEVFVSATKRDKAVRDIPISIDAFTGEDLIEKGATSLEDIVKYSPGVIVSGGNVTIRGLSNAGGLYTRTVGRFYDSVSLINPSIIGVQPHIDPYDMSSVEILKGPQGTLFGGAALAGAIRYVPNKPNLDDGIDASLAYTFGSIEHGEGDLKEIRAMINIPIFESIALRYTVANSETPGYVDDLFSGEKDVGDRETELNRASVLWRMTDSIDIQLSYLNQKTNYQGTSTINGDINNPRMERDNRRLPEYGNDESSIVGLRIDWGIGDIASITIDSNLLKKEAENQSDSTGYLNLENSPIRNPTHSTSYVEQPSHEVRLISNEVSEGFWLVKDWEYVIGLFYMESDQLFGAPLRVQAAASENLPVPFPILDPSGGTNTNLTAIAIEKALYFDMTRSLFSKLDLNLGGRYFEQTTDGKIYTNQEVDNPQGGSGVIAPNQYDGGPAIEKYVEEKGFNPKIALTWHFTEDIALLVSIADGFRYGGVNAINENTHNLSGQPYFFESDSIRNYEIGFRSMWFDRRLTADFAAFYIPWDNMQVQTSWNGTFPAVDNVGGALVRGGEMAVQAVLPFGMTLTANAAHIESKTTEEFDSAEGVIPAGAVLPFAPRWTGSVILANATQLGDWLVNSSLSYSYQDESKNNFNNTLPLASFDTFSIALSASNYTMWLSPKFRITVTNIENDKGILYGIPTANTDVMFAIQPRTIKFTAEISL